MVCYSIMAIHLVHASILVPGDGDMNTEGTNKKQNPVDLKSQCRLYSSLLKVVKKINSSAVTNMKVRCFCFYIMR